MVIEVPAVPLAGETPVITGATGTTADVTVTRVLELIAPKVAENVEVPAATGATTP